MSWLPSFRRRAKCLALPVCPAGVGTRIPTPWSSPAGLGGGGQDFLQGFGRALPVFPSAVPPPKEPFSTSFSGVGIYPPAGSPVPVCPVQVSQWDLPVFGRVERGQRACVCAQCRRAAVKHVEFRRAPEHRRPPQRRLQRAYGTSEAKRNGVSGEKREYHISSYSNRLCSVVVGLNAHAVCELFPPAGAYVEFVPRAVARGGLGSGGHHGLAQL